jgi:hypothetical protein
MGSRFLGSYGKPASLLLLPADLPCMGGREAIAAIALAVAA